MPSDSAQPTRTSPPVSSPQGLELLLGLVHHVQDVLRPLAQQHPLVGQTDAEAAADEELFPQLPSRSLSCLDSVGWEICSRFAAWVTLPPGPPPKIAQNTNFHRNTSTDSITGYIILFKNNMK